MSDLHLFLKGAAIGALIAAPVGPIALLCICRTFQRGPWSGLASGFGAATADTVYGGAAVLGLTLASNLVSGHGTLLRGVAGAAIFLLGANLYLSEPDIERAASNGAEGILLDYLSAFFLTIINPLTLLAFTSVFAVAGVTAGGAWLTTGALLSGVFLGAVAWWSALVAFVNLFRPRLDTARLRRINNVIGMGFMVIGVSLLAALAK